MFTKNLCQGVHRVSTVVFGRAGIPVVRRWNHSRANFQPRESQYGFYDLSIQQPIGSHPSSNPFPEMAEEQAKQEELAARMDEESGRTTGAGRPPDSPPINIIFGSRLAGPASRPAPPPEKVRIVEGIKVPPRPEEPDNCCMSGCVHCVWDIYREDIEDWQSTRQRARIALKVKKKRIPIWLGGKAAKEEEFDPLADIEPGLRAFMELEKKLKARKELREHPL